MKSSALMVAEINKNLNDLAARFSEFISRISSALYVHNNEPTPPVQSDSHADQEEANSAADLSIISYDLVEHLNCEDLTTQEKTLVQRNQT